MGAKMSDKEHLEPIDDQQGVIDQLNALSGKDTAKIVAAEIRACESSLQKCNSPDEWIPAVKRCLDFCWPFVVCVGAFPAAGTVFIRARPIDHHSLYEKISQLIYPPKWANIQLGRANGIGENIFYASNNLETVLTEVDIDAGKRGAIVLSAKVKTDKAFVAFPVGELDHFRRYGRVMTRAGQEHLLSEFLNSIAPDVRLTVNLVDAFLADHFRKPKSDLRSYALTSDFSSRARASFGVGAIFYPSAKHLGGFNIALSPNVFDQHCEVVDFRALDIIDYLGYGIYQYHQHAQGRTWDKETGVLHWEMNPVGPSGRQNRARLTIPELRPDGASARKSSPTSQLPEA